MFNSMFDHGTTMRIRNIVPLFDELKKVKYFKEITDFKSLIM